MRGCNASKKKFYGGVLKMSYPLILIDSEEAIRNAVNDLGMLDAIVQERRKFYEEHGRRELKKWLIRGSLILTPYGKIGLFTPFEHFKHIREVDVVEMKKNDVDGWTQTGGDHCSLPKKGSICPYCGKEVTIEDVYSHNFYIENSGNKSFAYHDGSCRKFHYTFTTSFTVAKEMILAAKRAFGEIEKVCVQEGNHEQDELVKISFMAVNYQIEILVRQYSNGISISYQEGNTRWRIGGNNYYYFASEVEETLKIWKDSL